MKKIILFTAILFVTTTVFSQDENNKTNKNVAIEFNVGKIFSPYRFYKNHKGYENISLGVSKDINSKIGVLFSQSYARVFSEKTNNRTIIATTTISPYLTFLSDKKLNLRFSIGTGLLFLNTKCLYDIYPISEQMYGVPIKANIAIFYKLNNKFALSINFNSHYSYLFKKEYRLLLNDSYYYKTFFYSTNIGVCYRL